MSEPRVNETTVECESEMSQDVGTIDVVISTTL